MKTLIIHPDDRSTDFLIPIYMNLGGFPDFEKPTVIRGGINKSEVKQLIIEHDRVIMLGHGTPFGLMSVGQFMSDPVLIDKKEDEYYSYPLNSGFIIDSSMVEELNKKSNNIYIWCNADKFVDKHNLKGFYTGMFISEYSEAHFCGVATFNGEVEQSNELFSKLVGEVVNESELNIYKHVRNNYSLPLSGVTTYNKSRMYFSKD